jgi:uncharacterized BrkB/YihY/UPF0761 family membrane protein
VTEQPDTTNKQETPRKKWKRTLIKGIISIAMLLTLHTILLLIMASGNPASIIFTGGADVPLLTLLTVLMFFITRLLVTLALPGLILANAGMVLWDYLHEKHDI